MSTAEIRVALKAQLETLTPPVTTQWENNSFSKPPPASPYQKVDILFATPANPVYGSGWQELGFMQVLLMYPVRDGPEPANLRAEAIRVAFKRGTSLVSGGVVVTVSRTPEIGGGRIDVERWSVPVKIPFYANMFA